MLVTQSIQIRGLTAEQYEILRYQCRLAKNMYNVGLYRVRQFFFAENRFLGYESNYHHCKDNENYGLLHSQVAQQCLKSVDEAMSGFFKLLGLKKEGKLAARISLPHYLKKDGYFPLVYPQPYIKFGKIQFSVSNKFRKNYRETIGKVFKPFKFPIPPMLKGKKLHEFRIIPKYKGRYFVAQFVYEIKEEIRENLDKDQCLSLDLGLNNLVAAIDTNGSSFLVDGRKLKSINQWYNKQLAKLQSIKDLNRIKRLTNKMAKLILKRTNQVNDYLKKTARLVINYCLEHKLGTLIVGVNKGWKTRINIGKVNNQNFVQIPFQALRQQLTYLCKRYGINYIEQEESYTSLASAYNLDNLPEYNADNPKTYEFSGKRIKRGLYRTKEQKLVNSDINGSANIGRKGKANLFEKREVLEGLLDAPIRYFIV
ncbi:MAG: transposase [Xenococcaceae cyanobacterium MO_167.B52]|nr:transposase [Xenococcaceae cyanobacterium MO_167.B52]